MDKHLLHFLLLSIPLLTVVSSRFESCAIKACHKLDPNKINVHLVPHSHDDVGWLKSVEDYFYGFHDEVQNVGVKYIFESVLQALKRNPERRYIQVETAFFWKWWVKQTEKKQKEFRDFVNDGKIEMVGGGWSMNDEACVNYQSVINQFTWGLRLLNDSLGECGRPKIGWQIDPFGHSREQASIFKQLGYDAFFFVRLSQDDKDARKATKDLEFLWKSNDHFDSSEIFTSILDSYYAPSDFCWDYLQCSSDAINDDPDSFDYNLDKKIAEFSEHIANYSSYFKTKNIIYAMGGDFQYQAAERNYINIDKLIKGFTNHSKYNVFYSTPSCYVKAVKEAKAEFSVKEKGDFFPYNENAHIYWSGYYSSRSTLKRFERVGNSILQAAEQMNAFAKMRNITNNDESEKNVESLREAMGTMQHHDAITGTEKETVAKDYARILTQAIRKTELNIGRIVGGLLKKGNITGDVNMPLSTCLLTNISVCENSMKDKFMVVVYNPLSRWVTHDLRLPAQKANYTVHGPLGVEKFEMINHMQYPVKSPFTESEVEIFVSVQIPPMGMKLLYVEKTNGSFESAHKELQEGEIKIFGNKRVNITLDYKASHVYIKQNGTSVEIKRNFMYYVSNNGTGDGITSGAYVFRPVNGTSAYPVEKSSDKSSKILYREGLQLEFIEKINDWLSQTTRIIDDEEGYIEYDWLVGPLDNTTVNTKFRKGKEVIVRHSISGMKNKYFFTDSNGRQMTQRERNNYAYNDSNFEPVTSNYFPVTSKISIKDEEQKIQFSVLTDRAQGGTSLKDGEIELMIHRRTLMDDHKGVEEPLQEMEYGNYLVSRGSHYVFLDSMKYSGRSTTAKERIVALKKLVQPWILIGDATSPAWSLDNVQEKFNFQWSGLKNGSETFPDNLNILNFAPWKAETYLLRLEHILEKVEDEELSRNVTVHLKDIFAPYEISSITETTLGANDWLPETITGDEYEVILSPMQIRTFIIEIK